VSDCSILFAHSPIDITHCVATRFHSCETFFLWTQEHCFYQPISDKAMTLQYSPQHVQEYVNEKFLFKIRRQKQNKNACTPIRMNTPRWNPGFRNVTVTLCNTALKIKTKVQGRSASCRGDALSESSWGRAHFHGFSEWDNCKYEIERSTLHTWNSLTTTHPW
jgi:hypothetical protein